MRCRGGGTPNELNLEGTMQNLFNLPDGDVFEITPLRSMNDLLVPGTSLCIAHKPCWDETGGTILCGWDWTEKSYVKGISSSGEKEKLVVFRGHINDLGRYKGRLDEHLLSAFLFVSWRKRIGYTFRMFQRHERIAEFPDLESAMAAYMPDGFTPHLYYRFAHTVQQLHFCSLMRRRTMLSLFRVFHRRVEQLSAAVHSELNEQDALETNEDS